MILWSSTTSDTGDNTLRNAFEPHPQPTSRQSNFNQQHHHLSQCVLRDTSPFRDQAPLPATAQATSPTTLSNHIRDQAPPETSQRTPCPTPPCHIREVRTPIAKAIWGKKQNKPEFLPFHLRSIDHQHPKTSTFTRAHAPQRHELHPHADFPPRLHARLLGEGPEPLDSLAPGNKWMDSVDSQYFMGAVLTQILKSWITYLDFLKKVSSNHLSFATNSDTNS